MIYYLQKTDRELIDYRIHDGAEILRFQDKDGVIRRHVEADSWLEAKEKMGFELTPLQEMLLEAN